GRRCDWLSASAAGLLVTVAETGEVWVVDPESLNVRRVVAVGPVTRAVSAPALGLAFAECPPAQLDEATVAVLDLNAGQVRRRYRAADFAGQRFGFELPTVTPDGKYLFTRGTNAQLLRFRAEGGDLRLDQAGPPISRGAYRGIYATNEYVCLPSGG